MAFDKKTEFGKRKQLLANYAKAISHPARIAILRQLAKQVSCNCQEIVNEMPLSQSTVSQHLKELKNAGLIEGTIDGPKSCYRLNKAQIKDFKYEITRLFSTLNPKNT